MNRLSSLQDIQNLIYKVREYRKGFITNFFLETFKHSVWIEKKEMYHTQIGETIFILRKTPQFTSLFYISTGADSLKESLSGLNINQDTDCVIDIVGNESIFNIKSIFLSSGFEEYTSLHRMNRIGALDFPSEFRVPGLSEACLEDCGQIAGLLNTYFDYYSEQIPSIEELEKWIESNQILVYKEQDNILGFIIYELFGVTLYLRYWFVDPSHRDKKIGSLLFNYFKYKGRETKRQLFWVVDSNENAIKRYKHYGFNSEKMFNYVLLKKRYVK